MLTTGKTTPIPGTRRVRTQRPAGQKAATAPIKQIGGIDVTEIKAIESLPGAPLRIAIATLADGSTVHACLDCPDPLDFTGTRGEVMSHRNAEHGARYGKRRPKSDPVDDELPDVLDAVLPPRADGNPAPDAIYEMTFGEVLALMPSIKALGDLIEKVETERDDLLTEVKELRVFERENKAKLMVYDDLREEVVGLRVQFRQWANYEVIKQEMYDLRAWKKAITKKLTAVGFQLTNTEEQ